MLGKFGCSFLPVHQSTIISLSRWPDSLPQEKVGIARLRHHHGDVFHVYTRVLQCSSAVQRSNEKWTGFLVSLDVLVSCPWGQGGLGGLGDQSHVSNYKSDH